MAFGLSRLTARAFFHALEPRPAGYRDLVGRLATEMRRCKPRSQREARMLEEVVEEYESGPSREKAIR